MQVQVNRNGVDKQVKRVQKLLEARGEKLSTSGIREVLALCLHQKDWNTLTGLLDREEREKSAQGASAAAASAKSGVAPKMYLSGQGRKVAIPPDTFIVSGSHGTIFVDLASGKPISVIDNCDCGESNCNYMDRTYDVAEWRKTYPGLELGGSDLDVVDIGSTGPDGVYDPPSVEWREDRAYRVIEGEREGEGVCASTDTKEVLARCLRYLIRLNEQDGKGGRI